MFKKTPLLFALLVCTQAVKLNTQYTYEPENWSKWDKEKYGEEDKHWDNLGFLNHTRLGEAYESGQYSRVEIGWDPRFYDDVYEALFVLSNTRPEDRAAFDE